MLDFWLLEAHTKNPQWLFILFSGLFLDIVFFERKDE